MNRVLTLLVFGAVCTCLSACGGNAELGEATSTPKVDQKKMEEEMKKSFERGKLKGAPPGASKAP
ncbi:MAG: hypothetical protein AABP62_00515 [Planctomycetota bacterium]